jgi:glycyl-tRNA synthetase beta chain
VIHRKGRATLDVLSELLPEAIAKLPWPKSMRWGDGTFRWVRPLHSIVATLDAEIVPFEVASVKSGNVTRGHRFLSQGQIEVRRFEDYEKKLRDAHVILDAAERRESILHDARQKAFALGLELIEDEGLANEVMGLAEWPVVLIGQIDSAFMDVPARSSRPRCARIRNISRCAIRRRASSPIVSPSSPTWSPKMAARRSSPATSASSSPSLRRQILLGPGQETYPRLPRHGPQGHRLPRQARHTARTRRTHRSARGRDREGHWRRRREIETRRASRQGRPHTGVVGEFPELQGVMGRYYALNDGEAPEIADAIRDHYKPLGPNDQVPSAKVSIAVGLADKVDTLVGFFVIDEKPTGSGDPYALRRAALGLIRLVMTSDIRTRLLPVLDQHRGRFKFASGAKEDWGRGSHFAESIDLLGFFADRLKVALREKGIRHDLIDGVFALGSEDDLVRLVRRVEALQAFLKTDDGANLLVGYRRAANILKIEEKKDKREYRDAPDTTALSQAEEKALHDALPSAQESVSKLLQREDFAVQ